MARKTAMGKEPGNVSIALPQSEKDRLRGNMRRMPGKARPIDEKGNFTDKQSLDRVSPGVYRNSQGKLVGSKGQALPKRSSIENALQGVSQVMGGQANMQPALRPGQQFSQQEMDAGAQAQNVAESIMAQYPSGNISNQQIVPYPMQIQSGYLPASPSQQQPIQDLMYRYPGGTPPDMRLFAPYNPQGMQNAQQQIAAQPNTVSGLLRRGR